MDAPFPKEMLPSIESFLNLVHPGLPDGLDCYPEVFHSELFYPLQRMREFAKMVRVIRLEGPRCVMEIGADKGGGFYQLLKALPGVTHAIANEIRGLPWAPLFERTFPRVRFLWLEGDSRSPASLDRARQWLLDEKVGIGALFIDGDKSAMEEDFDAYLPMTDGLQSVALLHDVTDPAPGAAFGRLKARGFQTSLIHDASEADEALAREAAGVPVTSPYEGWLRHWKGRSCGVGVVHLGY